MIKEWKILEEYYHGLYVWWNDLVTIYEDSVLKEAKDQIIVTLTTIPSRINQLYLVIESLLRQTLKADQIVLWLDYDHFDWLKIPHELNNQLARNLTIRYCKDYGSHKKLIPSLQSFPNSILVTCDDDAFYPKNRLETLYNNYLLNPTTIQCTRGHRMAFDNQKWLMNYMDREFNTKERLIPSLKIFPTWVWWILYFPHCFDKEVYNDDVFMKFCYNADDIWFKIMSLMHNVPCQISKEILTDKWEPFSNIYEVPNTQLENLVSSNIFKWRNDRIIKELIEHYKLEDLFKELAENHDA